jgi:RimJ/RimL family protein N-acetyltransferase
MEPTILSTARLVLRPWQAGDESAPMAWGADERFSRFLPLPRPYLGEHAREFVQSRADADWRVAPAFAITLGGRLIGDINARVEHAHGRAEIGYGIAPGNWGRGYTAEAARCFVGWLFESYPIAKVYARADAENRGSWRVMEKAGMVREAYHKSHRILRGERRDEVAYGVTRADWRG